MVHRFAILLAYVVAFVWLRSQVVELLNESFWWDYAFRGGLVATCVWGFLVLVWTTRFVAERRVRPMTLQEEQG